METILCVADSLTLGARDEYHRMAALWYDAIEAIEAIEVVERGFDVDPFMETVEAGREVRCS